MITKLILLLQTSIQTISFCELESVDIQLITNCEVQNDFNKVALVYDIFKKANFDNFYGIKSEQNDMQPLEKLILRFKSMYTNLTNLLGKAPFRNAFCFESNCKALKDLLDIAKNHIKNDNYENVNSTIMPMVEFSYHLKRTFDYHISTLKIGPTNLNTKEISEASLFFDLISLSILNETESNQAMFFQRLLTAHAFKRLERNFGVGYVLKTIKIQIINTRKIGKSHLESVQKRISSSLHSIKYYDTIYDIKFYDIHGKIFVNCEKDTSHVENTNSVASYIIKHSDINSLHYDLPVDDQHLIKFYQILNQLHQQDQKQLHCFSYETLQ